MTNTKSDPAAGELKIPSGTQVYDQIMATIESELVSANIPTLDVQYTGEAPEARTARYERYQAAFAKYDEAFKAWASELSQAVNTYRKHAIRSAEESSRAEESTAMDSLLSQFGSV